MPPNNHYKEVGVESLLCALVLHPCSYRLLAACLDIDVKGLHTGLQVQKIQGHHCRCKRDKSCDHGMITYKLPILVARRPIQDVLGSCGRPEIGCMGAI